MNLNLINEQIQLCMLPALTQDLDEAQLLRTHFESYQVFLLQQLPILYDLLQQNEEIFKQKVYKGLRGHLSLLLCELTASPTIYKLDAEALQENANKLLGKLAIKGLRDDEESFMFSYYAQKLHKDCWKRQLGAVHGFARYLELFYASDHRMSYKWLTFSLAVGLNVRECYETAYKLLGVRIFSIMLSHSHFDDIQQLNVQGVIYDNLFRDAYTMDSVELTAAVWNCLYQCLNHFTDLDSLRWNQCDDMLERLIQNVMLSSNAKLSACQLQFITQLGYYFSINRSEVHDALSKDLSRPEEMEACREVCSALNVSINYRWAKTILQMLALQSEKLQQSPETCTQLLWEMLRCYLVHIIPIPLAALNVHLDEFLNKFVAVMLQCLGAHARDEGVLQITQHFIDMFVYQLRSAAAQQSNNKLLDIAIALKAVRLDVLK